MFMPSNLKYYLLIMMIIAIDERLNYKLKVCLLTIYLSIEIKDIIWELLFIIKQLKLKQSKSIIMCVNSSQTTIKCSMSEQMLIY